MKNEEYEMNYKYAYKIGKYQASYDVSVNFFKMIFENEFARERKRIKWLSNYELKLFFDELYEYLSYAKDKNSKNNEHELKKHKLNILKLLR